MQPIPAPKLLGAAACKRGRQMRAPVACTQPCKSQDRAGGLLLGDDHILTQDFEQVAAPVLHGEEGARCIEALARAEQLFFARAAIADDQARRFVVFFALRGRQGVPTQGDEANRGSQRLAPVHIGCPDRIEHVELLV